MRGHVRPLATGLVMGALALGGLSLALAQVRADPQAACLANLKTLSTALLQYAQDYDDTLPPMKNSVQLQRSLSRRVKVRATFSCPVTKLPYQPNVALNCKPLAKVKKPATVEAIWDAKPHPGGVRNAVFADGHVGKSTKLLK